jgi:hypothetical protein
MKRILTTLFSLFIAIVSIAQPPNDDCANAIPVTIPNGGFGLGLFTSAQHDLTAATLQTGETFAPSIIVAGLNKKSMLYKFSLPTTRGARISLAQPGSGIQAGNVGFAVYKANTCIPGNAQISTKFSPIEIFGSSFHPCVEPGDYLVQVTSNLNANGPVFITVELGEPSPALYDKPANALQLGILTAFQQKFQDVDISCQTIDDANEVCLSTTSFKDYTKSIWYTFTTPAYLDYLDTWMGVTTVGGGYPTVKVGYRLYQGDATTTPVASLIQKGGCDSLLTDYYVLDKKTYKCGDLLPNTTYTVQLLFHKDFVQTIRVGTDWKGRQATKGPLPVNSLATPNNMGILNANTSASGQLNTISDVFGCNSRHSENSCPKTMPVNGVLFGGNRYNLSSFVSFNLATTSSILFTGNDFTCSGLLYLRLYKQSLTANCTGLDTTNLVASFNYYTYQSSHLGCLAPGDYVLQVMAVDSFKPRNYYSSGSLYNSANNALCFNGGLGSSYNLQLYVRKEVDINKFALNAAGKVDKLNTNGSGVMQPLLPNIAYAAKTDTFGCANTVMPSDTLCFPYSNQQLTKASYREFILDDSMMLYFSDYYSLNSKLYKGDAEDLTATQNKRNFPERFTGLTPYTNCLSSFNNGYSKYGCAAPGTYTLINFDNRLSVASDIKVTPKITPTKYANPANAENMGDLWQRLNNANGNIYATIDTFTCLDNPATIDGLAPCTYTATVNYTKLIYRQFYLNQPSGITIGTSIWPYSFVGKFTVFKGKATDGIGTLTKMATKWQCQTIQSTNGICVAFEPGWYTVVCYGYGPSYTAPLITGSANYQVSDLGLPNNIQITLTKACAAPKFNRPYKASVDTLTGLPYKIEYKAQTGSTAAYPKFGTTYTLNRENFDCSQDTGFIKQNMVQCNAVNAKVAFYLFQITQESFVHIDGIDESLWGTVYPFDVRTADSLLLKTANSFQPCLSKKGSLEYCKLQPGYYTLVFYAPATYNCNAVTPTIYIDEVGQSRFDHASNAYDFGPVLPDSTWYNGKPGDINPLNAGRTPSNDFFYCTTGARPTDPNDANCYVLNNPRIYEPGNNIALHNNNTTAPDYVTIDRRNLWYTFTLNHAGTIKVKVKNKTLGKQSSYQQYNFAVYKSNVDGTLPFTTVVNNGLVDSTLAQGLELVKTNIVSSYCYGLDEVSFFVPPCSFTPTRYYVLVDNKNGYPYEPVHSVDPNSQVEVSLLFDSVNAAPPKFDHFSQANDLGLVNSGIKKGATDNFTCATKDLPDPVYAYTSCQKTLWYKFTTTVTGTIRYAAFFKNTNNWYYDHIQLFRQVKPNDSSSTGLLHLPYTTNYFNNGYWAQQCISPGTYYIILPGCNAISEDVYPQIEIIPSAGDFCSTPMVTGLTGPGNRVVPVTVDCHTIGTDYGEFNPTLTCPAGAETIKYKTSWYRLDITGTDTLDVTVFINEKTNATSTDIKYRMMTGTCGAMQEQSCVLDALTRNTYKCLSPGNSYYIQVFSPILYQNQQVVGDIDLNISAVVHADTCQPASTCIGVANFTPQFDCTKDKDVIFTNFSTFGTSISYQWDFGYNGQTSVAVSPRFFYPALTTAQTYTVKLVLTNSICGKKDSVTQTITIPARPSVNLGNDTVICTNASTLLLDATSHTGSTYAWYNGST